MNTGGGLAAATAGLSDFPHNSFGKQACFLWRAARGESSDVHAFRYCKVSLSMSDIKSLAAVRTPDAQVSPVAESGAEGDAASWR